MRVVPRGGERGGRPSYTYHLYALLYSIVSRIFFIISFRIPGSLSLGKTLEHEDPVARERLSRRAEKALAVSSHFPLLECSRSRFNFRFTLPPGMHDLPTCLLTNRRVGASDRDRQAATLENHQRHRCLGISIAANPSCTAPPSCPRAAPFAQPLGLRTLAIDLRRIFLSFDFFFHHFYLFSSIRTSYFLELALLTFG